MWWVLFLAVSFAIPNYQACVTTRSKALPFCNSSLSRAERVQWLVSQLSLEEKVGLIAPDRSIKGSHCPEVNAPVDRFDIPPYMWLVETNTAVSSACLGPEICATTFIGPEGLAASFNRSLWFAKGDVISTEMRAFNNNGGFRPGQVKNGPIYFIGLSGFGPNINLAAHPLWGRNSEVPGEDPFLSGEYSSAYTRGLQQIDDQGYLKMLSYLKHFAVYEIDQGRDHNNFDIDMFSWFDTFLPAFQKGFVEGRSSGAMCSYTAENGRPSCANAFLLNDVMRGLWNRSDAIVSSDCGAISNMRGKPLHCDLPLFSRHCVADALNSGCDMEMGSIVYPNGIHNAVKDGLLSMITVDQSVTRVLMQLFSVGRFDDPEKVSWTSIPLSSIRSKPHVRVVEEAGAQSMVLLKNSNATIPIRSGINIAVIGPMSIATSSLLSDYYGDEVCFSSVSEGPRNYSCIPTLGDSIARLNRGNTTILKGVDIDSQDTSGIAEALAAAKSADLVVLALGIDTSIEREAHDRTSTTLPGLQESFALQVYALGKPVVLTLCNGGILSIDNLIKGASAIVELFNPSFSTPGMASALFGEQTNAWGKLPVTIYNQNYTNEISDSDMNMTAAPGRTYRYFTGTPLWPFGFGLNPLTSFVHSCDATKLGLTVVNASCLIKNVGQSVGDEVIQVYHSAGSDVRSRVVAPVPIKTLRQFERVTVAPGQQAQISWEFDLKTLVGLINENGVNTLYSGTHKIIFSRGNPDQPDQIVNIHV